jgi:hypothetical protein
MIILGQYITKSKNNNLGDYAIGINYPYTMTKETFDKSYTNIEALRKQYLEKEYLVHNLEQIYTHYCLNQILMI